MSVPKKIRLDYKGLDDLLVRFGTDWYGLCYTDHTPVPTSPNTFRCWSGTLVRRHVGDLTKILKTISSLDELEGFANSSRVLGVRFAPWTASQAEQIKRRKWEIEHGV